MTNIQVKNFSVFTLQKKQDKVNKLINDERLRLYKEYQSLLELAAGDKKKLAKLSKEEVSDEFIENANKIILDYVYKYYFETAKGDYYLYEANKDEFSYRTQKDFINEVCNKLYDGSFKQLFQRNPKIYTVVSRLDKPRVFEENNIFYINECRGFLHKNYKPYDEYSAEIKEKVQIVLDMIKEISCSNNEELFTAYVKYLSQLCRGQKTDVIIYKKSEQGVGKSTETEFLMNYVLGKDICLLSGTEPLTSNFNKCFLGKLLVIFEELPTFGLREWEAVSSKLKTLTTEKTAMYRGLFKDAIQAENISNFMINTNVESIKNSDGRRYIIMPLSDSRKGDYDYFENLRNKCFNLEVGEAFYSKMMSIDITGYYAQKCFPDTENKRLAIANQLDPIEKFIKFNYVLKKRGITKIKTNHFHQEYLEFCSKNNFKPLSNTLFYSKLKSLCKIERGPKNNGNFYFNVPLETLEAFATKNKWICEYDEVIEEDDDDDDEKVSGLDKL